MNPTQTQSFARNSQSAAQKFASKVNVFKSNVVNAVAVVKQVVSEWTARPASRNPLLAETHSLQSARDNDFRKYYSVKQY